MALLAAAQSHEKATVAHAQTGRHSFIAEVALMFLTAGAAAEKNGVSQQAILLTGFPSWQSEVQLVPWQSCLGIFQLVFDTASPPLCVGSHARLTWPLF